MAEKDIATIAVHVKAAVLLLPSDTESGSDSVDYNNNVQPRLCNIIDHMPLTIVAYN